MSFRPAAYAASVALGLALVIAGTPGAPEAGAAPDAPFTWDLPPGFPIPAVPADNPMSAVKVELGRRLFHDPRLSGNGTLACSGCHRPEHAYSDGRARALGAQGGEHPRSTMSLANVAYEAALGWDDPRMTTLEDQALVPLLGEHPVEMGVAGREREVLDRLVADPWYPDAFDASFPGEDDPVTLRNVTRALAAFERTLISGDSPFDRWAYRGQVDALDPQARAGARLFFSRRLACSRCHGGVNFSGPTVFEGSEAVEPRYHNTGLYDLDGTGRYPPSGTGVHRITGRDEDMGRFRAPTLRNVALTAPYMHDGSVETLEDVVDHYAAGGRAARGAPGTEATRRDPLVAGFAITEREREQLLAFLHALTDTRFLDRARRLEDPARP